MSLGARLGLLAAAVLMLGCGKQAESSTDEPGSASQAAVSAVILDGREDVVRSAPQGSVKSISSPGTQAECERENGHWQEVPGLQQGIYACQLSFSDAGASCTDPADCLGNCLAETAAAKTGQCQATSAELQCATILVGGEVFRSPCWVN